MGSMLFGVVCIGALFLIFAAIGVWLILRYQQNKQKAQQSVNWPTTSGRVIESRISEHESEDEDGHTTSTYAPVVRFEYQVEGVTYTSDRMGVGSKIAISNRKKVEQQIAGYPEGKLVRVYYNPQNPAEAVLETRLTSKAELVAGIILIVVGLSILCLGVGGILLSSLSNTRGF
ncbi:DUF3592 domain-containing protein [Bellilinea sp.]|uniref:DUF3592 domain-containing protein n=1 Tax=Bellilinea sp. TaxID=2838785 RepID=UPI002ADE7A55|nr:DUF3592 domain-containing protein [Bellilinea sp.]